MEFLRGIITTASNGYDSVENTFTIMHNMPGVVSVPYSFTIKNENGEFESLEVSNVEYDTYRIVVRFGSLKISDNDEIGYMFNIVNNEDSNSESYSWEEASRVANIARPIGVQYSEDGVNWLNRAPINTVALRFSHNGGETWGNPIFVGRVDQESNSGIKAFRHSFTSSDVVDGTLTIEKMGIPVSISDNLGVTYPLQFGTVTIAEDGSSVVIDMASNFAAIGKAITGTWQVNFAAGSGGDTWQYGIDYDTSIATASTASFKPSSITLPVPYDDNGENLLLIVGFCENKDFFEEDVSNSDSCSNADFVRYICMGDEPECFKVSSNGQFVDIPSSGLGLPYYGESVVLTIDKNRFKWYKPGNTYYARARWVDQSGGFSDWRMFKVTYDAVDTRPVQTEQKYNKTYLDNNISGNVSLDFNNGRIQTFNMVGDVNLSTDNITGIPFGIDMTIIINKSEAYELSIVGSPAKVIPRNESGSYVLRALMLDTIIITVSEVI